MVLSLPSISPSYLPAGGPQCFSLSQLPLPGMFSLPLALCAGLTRRVMKQQPPPQPGEGPASFLPLGDPPGQPRLRSPLSAHSAPPMVASPTSPLLEGSLQSPISPALSPEPKINPGPLTSPSLPPNLLQADPASRPSFHFISPPGGPSPLASSPKWGKGNEEAPTLGISDWPGLQEACFESLGP